VVVQPVAPGDTVLRLPDVGVVRLGGGLHDTGTHIVAVRPGLLRQTGDKFWVMTRRQRYVPCGGDPVIGIVRSKGSEFYEVDVGGPFAGLLPVLAFEGATRRNRPNLKENDLVYCRVETADRDLPPTLACTDAAGRAAGFGPLKEGHTLECSAGLCRDMLRKPTPTFLERLGKEIRFELAVGLNGKIWVNAAGDPGTLISVSRALQACDACGGDEQGADRAVESVLKDMRVHAGGGSGGGGDKKKRRRRKNDAGDDDAEDQDVEDMM
jgi:exosome complex component RRP40